MMGKTKMPSDLEAGKQSGPPPNSQMKSSAGSKLYRPLPVPISTVLSALLCLLLVIINCGWEGRAGGGVASAAEQHVLAIGQIFCVRVDQQRRRGWDASKKGSPSSAKNEKDNKTKDEKMNMTDRSSKKSEVGSNKDDGDGNDSGANRSETKNSEGKIDELMHDERKEREKLMNRVRRGAVKYEYDDIPAYNNEDDYGGVHQEQEDSYGEASYGEAAYGGFVFPAEFEAPQKPHGNRRPYFGGSKGKDYRAKGKNLPSKIENKLQDPKNKSAAAWVEAIQKPIPILSGGSYLQKESKKDPSLEIKKVLADIREKARKNKEGRKQSQHEQQEPSGTEWDTISAIQPLPQGFVPYAKPKFGSQQQYEGGGAEQKTKQQNLSWSMDIGPSYQQSSSLPSSSSLQYSGDKDGTHSVEGIGPQLFWAIPIQNSNKGGGEQQPFVPSKANKYGGSGGGGGNWPAYADHTTGTGYLHPVGSTDAAAARAPKNMQGGANYLKHWVVVPAHDGAAPPVEKSYPSGQKTTSVNNYFEYKKNNAFPKFDSKPKAPAQSIIPIRHQQQIPSDKWEQKTNQNSPWELPAPVAFGVPKWASPKSTPSSWTENGGGTLSKPSGEEKVWNRKRRLTAFWPDFMGSDAEHGGMTEQNFGGDFWSPNLESAAVVENDRIRRSAFRTSSAQHSSSSSSSSSSPFEPAVGVKIELYEGDTWDFDDLLDTVETDKQGRFSVEGSENELSWISPYLWITHNCPIFTSAAYNEKNCKFAQKVPLSHYTTNSTHDMGPMVFGGSHYFDKVICE